MAEGGFFFVDGINPDRASKRLMRRHVMKGKNAGKTFHRQSRLELAKRQPKGTTQGIPAHSDIEEHYGKLGLACPTTVNKELGNSFTSFTTPVEVTSYALKIINQFFTYTTNKIYPIRLGTSIEVIKYTWLRVFFADEASFHCNLALMQASNEIFQDDGFSSAKALYHLSQTFSWVKRKLEGDEPLSDSSIGIVLSLVTQEQIRKEHNSAQIHFDGLRRMIELRGGLDDLESCTLLLLKVCKVDIIFCLQNGTSPKFFRDRMPEVRSALAAMGIQIQYPSAGSLVGQNELDPNLEGVLLDLMSVSYLFKNVSEGRKVDILTLQEMLISMGYRLLRFHSLDYPNQLSSIQAVYHVGMMFFMATIWLQYDRQRILDYGLISRSFRVVLDGASAECDNELLLWLTIVGGIWTSGDANNDWLIPKLRTTAQNMGIGTWNEAASCLGKFPWIPVIHDEPGHALWNKMIQI